MKTKIFFANSAGAATAELVSFTNDLTIGDDGWAQLAPFGDFPGRAMLRQGNGEIQTFDAIQRLDRAAAEGMTAKFKSPWHRVKRFITGCHIYAGHPDVPAFANDYPDQSPKGMIVDLAVRDDGLYCKTCAHQRGQRTCGSEEIPRALRLLERGTRGRRRRTGRLSSGFFEIGRVDQPAEPAGSLDE